MPFSPASGHQTKTGFSAPNFKYQIYSKGLIVYIIEAQIIEMLPQGLSLMKMHV